MMGLLCAATGAGPAAARGLRTRSAAMGDLRTGPTEAGVGQLPRARRRQELLGQQRRLGQCWGRRQRVLLDWS